MYTPAINNESKCSIYEKDGYVTIVEELDTTDKSAIVISWKAILFIICLFIGIKTISANVFDSKKQETTQSTSIQTTGETVSVSKTEYAAVPDSNSYEDPLDKELASWNCLMIAALARSCVLLGKDEYLSEAKCAQSLLCMAQRIRQTFDLDKYKFIKTGDIQMRMQGIDSTKQNVKT